MIATSVNQSKKLLELGLDPKTADMHYFPQIKDDFMLFTVPFNKEETVEEGWAPEIIDAIVPAWSLGALIEILPYSIQEQQIDIRKDQYYQIAYGNYTQNDSWSDMISTPYCNTLLEAAYAMVAWLLDNKYI